MSGQTVEGIRGDPANDRARRKKKVTAFVGSGHRGGATDTAARVFLDDLESFGDVEGEIVTLGDYSVGTCRGCKACFEPGEESCPLKDDRDVLLGTLAASDGVVFASPNYSFQVSGLMKVFLDRLGFLFHRPRLHGKTATSIVVQGIYGGRQIRKYLDFVEGGLGFNVVKGSVVRTLEPMNEKAVRLRDEALARQSRRFHEQLLRPPFPAPSLLGLVAFRMGRQSVRLLLGEDKRDHIYYRDHGWFESDYYYPTRLGVLKKVAGTVLDWAGARMYRGGTEAGSKA